jgi:hypothetical protein
VTENLPAHATGARKGKCRSLTLIRNNGGWVRDDNRRGDGEKQTPRAPALVMTAGEERHGAAGIQPKMRRVIQSGCKSQRE